jgi:carbon monoxide dehydrogenase subunit G
VRLENEFTVPAPVERAWDVLLDVERVAPCLPGAAVESSDGDEHVGTMAVKIGPITARYRGTVRVEEADVDARRAVMRAQATDQRGRGTAAARITSTMEPVPGGTRVRVATEMQITGPAAQFGRGVMQEVSGKLMRRFAECLADEIANAPAAPAAPERAGAPERATAPQPQVPPAPSIERVPTGTAGVLLPPGPAAAAAEAAARGRVAAAGAPSRSPASPPAADDVASPRRTRPTEAVLDLGEVGRQAMLTRALPLAAGVAVAGAGVVLLHRRGSSASMRRRPRPPILRRLIDR